MYILGASVKLLRVPKINGGDLSLLVFLIHNWKKMGSSSQNIYENLQVSFPRKAKDIAFIFDQN